MKFKSILILLAIAAVLGVVWFAVSRPKPVTPAEPRPYVWDFDQDQLTNISISLPRATDINPNSMAWVKHEDRYFYFDVLNGPKVDMQRWGGGIPLILSGPGADRRLFADATDDKIKELGFSNPSILIKLALADTSTYEIELGDASPSGLTYYIRLAGSRDVFTVDGSWFDVIANLVKDPPYQPAAIIPDGITVTPAEVARGQPVTISVVMLNNGTKEGDLDVVFKINGVAETTKKTNVLKGGERQTIDFTTTKNTAGVYSVNVNGATGKFTVK